MKAEKKRRKELEATLKDEDAHGGALFIKSPRSWNKNGVSDNTGEGERIFSARSLPPLEPLGTPFLEENGETRKKKKKKKTPRGTEPPTEQLRQSKDKTTDDDEDVVLATPRSQPVLSGSLAERSTRTISNIQVSTHDDFPSREMLAAGISRVLPPLDGGAGGGDADTPRTRKVKKKKLRQLGANQNGHARMAGAGEKEETVPMPRLMSLDGGGE